MVFDRSASRPDSSRDFREDCASCENQMAIQRKWTSHRPLHEKRAQVYSGNRLALRLVEQDRGDCARVKSVKILASGEPFSRRFLGFPCRYLTRVHQKLLDKVPIMLVSRQLRPLLFYVLFSNPDAFEAKPVGLT